MLNQGGHGKATRSFDELSPQEMLDELRSEMTSIRGEDRALKQQILDLSEQFQEVVRLASTLPTGEPKESPPPKTKLSAARRGAASTQTSQQQSRLRYNSGSRSFSKKQTSSFDQMRTRAKLGLRLSLGERLKTLQERAREERAKARDSPTTPTDSPVESPTSRTSPQKSRSSATSPVEGRGEADGVSNGRDGHRRKNLKKRMTADSRKVDVVHLGLF